MCLPGKLVDKLKTPESTLAEIRALDEPASTVDSAVIAVENCCTRPKTLRSSNLGNNTLVRYADHSAAREHLHKLRELLNEFMPLISKIDRRVDKIYKGIEGKHEGSSGGEIESQILITIAASRKQEGYYS